MSRKYSSFLPLQDIVPYMRARTNIDKERWTNLSHPLVKLEISLFERKNRSNDLKWKDLRTSVDFNGFMMCEKISTNFIFVFNDSLTYSWNSSIKLYCQRVCEELKSKCCTQTVEISRFLPFKGNKHTCIHIARKAKTTHRHIHERKDDEKTIDHTAEINNAFGVAVFPQTISSFSYFHFIFFGEN